MTDTPRPRVLTEPLGGSPLSLSIQARRLPAELQPWWPATVDDWREHVTRARADGGWYSRLRDAVAPTGAAKTRVERAIAERGVVVTTGQQPGLFGGPLYTLSKALSALALADALEHELGIAAAPVFWAATDDADFVEASVTYAADADGLHRLRLETPPPAGTPMSDVPLGDIDGLLESLRARCGSAAHEMYFEHARRAFSESKTLGGAYVQLLRGLLEPLGICVLDASHSAYRDASRPFMLEALKRAPEIAAAVAERSGAIRSLQFDPQFEDDRDRGLSLVFVLERGIKRRLTIDEAARYARRPKELPLAANVLLRPLVERELLPTVGYIAGPAELAYFAQANAVAEALERAPLVPVPRWSGTVIEPFAQRAMQRLGVEYHELGDRPAIERRLATAGLPQSVAAAWAQLQEHIRAGVRELGDAVARESLMPPEVIEGLARSLGHKLARGERRLLAAVKRRDERARRDLAVATGALMPLGQRQERVLNYIPMLARGGAELVEELLRGAREHARSVLQTSRSQPVAAR